MVGPHITATVNPRIDDIRKVVEMTRGDLSKMTTQMDILFRKNEKRLFNTEGSSGGRKWPKLSPRYKKQKRKKFPGRKIMVATGRLRKGLTVKSHPDHIARHTKDSIKIGVANVLPAYHGSVKGRKNPRLPKRDVFQMTPKQRRSYYRVLFDRYELKRKQFMLALRAGRAQMRRGA